MQQLVICAHCSTHMRWFRAGFLLKGAKHVVNDLDGKLPETAAQLAKIPGIGPYTSAAVASIAFNEAIAAVDGNVHRVMARLFAIPGTVKEKAFCDAVGAAAGSLLCHSKPGDFNQAVMELGAY
jgi:A/G-specific adenine glycosylase